MKNLASGASQGDQESIKMIDGVVEITSGDDNISTDLLEWSGLDAIWENRQDIRKINS